jgi:ATP-dependent Clp protease ATP-binding subunit ClpC
MDYSTIFACSVFDICSNWLDAVMSDLEFNYHSIRSGKARIGVKFSKNKINYLTLGASSFLVLGILALFYHFIFGWLAIGIASVMIMIVEWYHGELHHMKPSDNPKTIDDVLSADILGQLSKNPSPLEIATIIGGVTGGQFMEARFGISSKFLSELASNNSDDMQNIWQGAWTIYGQTNSKNISASVLMAAIINSAPNHQRLLSHLQLDSDDLLQGIAWYNYLRKLIDEEKVPKLRGGFARDWAFGWTPLLRRFGQNISENNRAYDATMHRLVAHDDALKQLISIFSSQGRQNAVLVGPDGVGKNQIIDTFATALMNSTNDIDQNLKYRQVFLLDASSLIAAAPGRGELESLVPKIFEEAYKAKNIIICLDNAQLFFQESIGSVDLTNILMPYIEAGNLRLILTMDEQHYLQISKRNTKLSSSLNKIVVEPATKSETIAVLQDRSILIELQHHVTFMYQALVEVYRLSDRYIHELAMPGKAISLLESSAQYSENGLVTAASVQHAIENTFNVKVSLATGEQERKKLLDMEDLIHQRMINQKRAVQVVSDALRRARAGVSTANRPIGTFLFLGPTGVGKTELSKALAEVYFGDEGDLIRLDMNEYSDSSDVERLIADSSDNAHSLTAKIMKKPFSVVLLDEIEKAHPNVVLTLLQMLDEGILRDVRGREVSFRDAIIIATSNAGAGRISEYIDRGYDITQFESKIVDELISSKQFKPEFINRFDEIIVFRPLNKKELVQVVDLMIVNVNKTMALQQISVTVDDDAKQYLVESGYDPHMGARPMRRVIQRAVENTVAKQMLSGSIEPGSTININLEQVKKSLAK